MTLAAKPVLIEEGEWLAHQGKSLNDYLSEVWSILIVI